MRCDLLSAVSSADTHSVADPGFPVRCGVGAISDTGAYWQKRVKTKELDPVGGGGRHRRLPLDPPMPFVSEIVWMATEPGGDTDIFIALMVPGP